MLEVLQYDCCTIFESTWEYEFCFDKQKPKEINLSIISKPKGIIKPKILVC
jgi:hypothetical protein